MLDRRKRPTSSTLNLKRAPVASNAMDSDLKCTDDVTWARRLGSKPASRPRLVASPAGQAMVESAIILPMYVFLMLGLLQLGLMHQAQTLTKYAAL